MASHEWVVSGATAGLSGAFNDKTASDLTLVAVDRQGNSTEFFVSRSVMMQASEYWEALLSWPREDGEGPQRVELREMDAGVLGGLLGSIYGRPVGGEVPTLLALVMAADRFQMSTLLAEAAARFVSLAPPFKSDHQELLLQIFKSACQDYDPETVADEEPKNPTNQQKVSDNGVETPQSEEDVGDSEPPRKRARVDEEGVKPPTVQPIEPLVVMEDTIQAYCIAAIINSIGDIFADASLLARFNLPMIRTIAVSDELPIKEIELFHGLVQWCKVTQTPFPRVETFARYPFMSPVDLKEVREADVVSSDILPMAYECMLLQDVRHVIGLPYLEVRGKNTGVNTELWMQPRQKITIYLDAPADCDNVALTWRSSAEFECDGQLWKVTAMPVHVHAAGMKTLFAHGTELKRKRRKLPSGDLVPVAGSDGEGGEGDEIVEVDDNRVLTLSTYWLGPKPKAGGGVDGVNGVDLERAMSGVEKMGWEDSIITYCRRMKIVNPGTGKDYVVTSPKWRTALKGTMGALTWYLDPITQMAQYVKDGKFEIRLGLCSRGTLNPPSVDFLGNNVI